MKQTHIQQGDTQTPYQTVNKKKRETESRKRQVRERKKKPRKRERGENRERPRLHRDWKPQTLRLLVTPTARHRSMQDPRAQPLTMAGVSTLGGRMGEGATPGHKSLLCFWLCGGPGDEHKRERLTARSILIF